MESYFIHEHAARNWAYQVETYEGRKATVKKLDKPTREGARWVVITGEYMFHKDTTDTNDWQGCSHFE